MTLMEQIDGRLHDAIKARDLRSADCLRMLKSKLIEKRTSPGFQGELTDAVVRDVAATYVKQLQRSIAEFEKAGEAGRGHIEKVRWEIEALSEYLPKHLDEAATRPIVEAAIRDTGATQPGQAGRVIGVVMKAHKDEVDAALVRRLVEEMLRHGA
ncbi:MAG: GatB/YqeY domain-containing protein [Candidatus Eisenbacteria bacterium]|nr:GatB/YqeY domain-containing protein [Candidatus Eisenbacteria bacterium]